MRYPNNFLFSKVLFRVIHTNPVFITVVSTLFPVIFVCIAVKRILAIRKYFKEIILFFHTILQHLEKLSERVRMVFF